ncbi:hypothetical protein M378DRAFT_18653 [Amanita muscaria Koide BX008]|uniref:Uncharacterized protein n=1 Tax=Amanita muscaria (strain Koide BX008) TaxID=946122 RepID=A0A0C2W0Q0_AMAMK|nr:hypothetical protein M378DRAFT_18653 [Amanita muscaria Koide BX008]
MSEYRLSTEKKDTLLCDLTSQKQFDTLIDFIRPKRGNSKQAIVDLYNKRDVQAEGMQNISNQSGKKAKEKQKTLSAQHRNGTTPQNNHDDSFEKRTAIRQSLIELHSCPTHSHPDKKATCWKDGGQGLCYPVTESNLNLWATLHLEHPEKYTLTEKPAEIKVHLNGPRSRAPATKAAQALGGMGPGAQLLAFGGLGYPSMPYGYPPYPFPMPQQHPNQIMPAVVEINAELDIEYPSISEWLSYCDRHPRRSSSRLSQYADAFNNEGFVFIDQLVGPRITIENLAGWLSIGKGTSDLVIRYAEQDVQLVKAGKFQLFASESST